TRCCSRWPQYTKRSLSKTTSMACTHHGCVATVVRKLVGTTAPSHPANRVSSQKTTPLQRRYWPRKKHRSVHHASRKNPWPWFAGNSTSSGRKTAIRKRKLTPTEISNAWVISDHRGGGCCTARFVCVSEGKEKETAEVEKDCKKVRLVGSRSRFTSSGCAILI